MMIELKVRMQGDKLPAVLLRDIVEADTNYVERQLTLGVLVLVVSYLRHVGLCLHKRWLNPSLYY